MAKKWTFPSFFYIFYFLRLLMFTLVLPRKALSLSLTKVLPQIWKYLANQKTKTSCLVAWPQNTGKEKVWPLQSVDGWHARYHFNDRHVWVSLKMNYLQGILLYFHTEISRIHSLHSTGGRTVIFGLQKSNNLQRTERCSECKVFVNISLPQR